MPIASAVVVPIRRNLEESLSLRLDSLEGVEVKGVGAKGVAVVLEAKEVERIKQVSEEIKGWEEVIDFQLVYFNWEDLANDP